MRISDWSSDVCSSDLEAIFQHDPEKTAPQILKLLTAILFHKRLVQNPDGEQDHTLVQHLVVLQVMRQRLTHALGCRCHYNGRTGHAHGDMCSHHNTDSARPP